LEDARQKAKELLDRGDIFKCVYAPVADSSLPEQLARELRAVLSRYQTIETAAGPSTAIDRSRVWSPAPRAGFLSIGTGMSGTDVEYEIATRTGREEIVELHPGENPDPTFGTYPSIHHWLLAVAGEVEEARSGRAD
jgi:hypothetical protein